MSRIRRLIDENTYNEFVGKILNNSTDTISNSVIDDVELIKHELMRYDFEKMELIKAHTASLKEGFRRKHDCHQCIIGSNIVSHQNYKRHNSNHKL